MKSNASIIIAGGGVIGLACAHYLSQSHSDILVIDKNEIGSGASHGNCGLLHYSGVIPLCAPGAVTSEMFRMITKTSPLYIKPTLDPSMIGWLFKFASHCSTSHMKNASVAKTALLKYSLSLFDDLFSNEPLFCELEKKGILIAFRDKRKFEEYKKTDEWLEKFGFKGTFYPKDRLHDIEPCLKEDLAGAYHNGHDWHLRPDVLMASWKKHLSKKGVRFLEYAGATEVVTQQRQVKQILTPRGAFSADAFVLSAGAWSGQAIAGLKTGIPVIPGKGYSITFKRPDPCPSIPVLLSERNMVVTPFQSGYRLGGTMEFSGFGLELNPQRLGRLVQGVKEYLVSSSKEPTVEKWAGLRPMTHDDLPIIDRAPGHDNLFLATGHGMLGLTMATGTGRAIADMINGSTPDIDLSAFSARRF